MKRFLTFLCVVAFLFGMVGTSNAALFPVVYDDDLKITWLGNAGLGGLSNWYDAKVWAEGLVYVGHDDWRLPWIEELYHLYHVEAVSHSDPGPFENLGVFYWSGTESAAPDYVWGFTFDYGTQAADCHKDGSMYAWAVRPGAPIPVPGTLLLLGSGLLGIAGIRKRFKK